MVLRNLHIMAKLNP